MSPLGFEPRTSAVSEQRSNQAELRALKILEVNDFIKVMKNGNYSVIPSSRISFPPEKL